MDEFKKYLQVVSELNTIASRIEEWLDKNIYNIIGGSQTWEAKISFGKWPEEIKKIVVSGLKAERYKSPYYATNAYAKFIEDFIGVKLENPALLVEKLSFGEDLSDINIVFTKTWFIEFVSKVREKTDFILKKASELGFEISAPRAVEKPIHELIEEFIEKTQEITVGVNGFATSVWGLRKIMPSYMKEVYGDISKQVLDILGFKKLLGVKHVELWGFEDYFTQSAVYCIDSTPWLAMNNVPASSEFRMRLAKVNDIAKRQRIITEARGLYNSPPTTLGGTICSLNQVAWTYARRLNRVLDKWFRDYVDLETGYVRKAWEILGATGWAIPEYLNLSQDYHNILSEYSRFAEGFIYNENGMIEKMISGVQPYYSYCVCRYLEPPRVALLARVIYDLAPAMLLGISDITLKLRLHGRASRDNLCEDLTYSSSDVLSYEDVNAVVVFFRKV
jgi:hypothetical protein